MKTCKSLWNRQWILGSLLAAGLLAPCGICRGETVYDAAADLTKEVVAANANPNGPVVLRLPGLGRVERIDAILRVGGLYALAG